MKIENTNAELLLLISDGQKSDIDSWAGTEIDSFFTYLKAQEERMKKHGV